jgi:hypothetical protein
MPSVVPALDHSKAPPPLYSKAELIELRRNILLYARSFPPGFERNQRRQIALSLRSLFYNAKWLDAHTLERSAGEQRVQTFLSESGLRRDAGLATD